MPFTVCVYAASSEAVGAHHRAVARAFGAGLAQRRWAVVYGGGGIGLMGEVARAALAGGASVTGIIPHRLARREVAFDDVTELIRVDTMRERKQLMDERADAFAVLPGGIGTLEELMEILTLRQLGYHDRTVILVDPGGYWDPLLAMFDRMVAEGVAAASVRDLYAVACDAEAALALLEAEAARSTADGPLAGARPAHRPGNVGEREPLHQEAGGR